MGTLLRKVQHLDRRTIFDGRVLHFRQVPAMVKLCALARHHIGGYLAEVDDEALRRIGSSVSGDAKLKVQEAEEAMMASRAFVEDDEHIVRVCRRFEKDAEAGGLMREAMVSVGSEAAHTFVDRLRLRVQPSKFGLDGRPEVDRMGDRRKLQGRFSCTLPVHRDSWGSELPAQINWWAPLLPIAADRTLQLYPALFTEPVPNTSADWDFEALKASRKQSAVGADAYPLMPVFVNGPTAFDGVEGDWEARLRQEAVPVVIEPGDLLAFSGAHLHASVPNGSGLSRFSTEWRTVDDRDLVAGVGASNVDGYAPCGARTEWFKHVLSGRLLGTAANDDSA